MVTVIEGLQRCKESLKKWSKETVNKQRGSITAKLNHISKLQNLNVGDHTSSIKQLQKEVDGLLEEEDVRWKQRAKQTWLKDGDRNNKFYHMCAN